MKVSDFCIVLDKKLQVAPDKEKLRLSALALQQAFSVTDNEVAFLKLDSTSEMLRFVWPLQLAKSGSIPLQNRDSLAARTVRDTKAELHNDFNLKRHSSFFELVNLDSAKAKAAKDVQNSGPKVIQKIMSAPLVDGYASVGAVQVSRKADNVSQAGPDFNDLELKALAEISKVLARYI